MIIHIYNFLFLSFFTIFFSLYKIRLKEQKYFIIIFLSLISILDGIRYNCYFDYNIYKFHYNKINLGFIFERGYEVFTDFFRFFKSYNFMLFVISILIYYLVFYKNYKILGNNILCVYIIFIEIIPFIGVNRQLLSICFLCIGIRYLIVSNKIIKFILFCLLGGSFHITALFIIPLGIIYYFFSKFILKNRIYIIFIIIVISHIFILYDVNKFLKTILSYNTFLSKYIVYFTMDLGYKIGVFKYLIRNIELLLPIIFLYLDKKSNKRVIMNKYFIFGLIGILFYYFMYFTFYGKFQILVGRLGLTLRGIFLPLYYTSACNLIKNKKVFVTISIVIFGILFLKTMFGEESYQYIYKTIFSVLMQ